MDIYADNILDHFRHPRHQGQIANATVSHEEKNIECGDIVQVWLRISGGKIIGISWEGTGCAISQASMSILSEELEGMSEEKIQALSKDDVYELLGVPIGPRRFKCALMGLHAVKNALRKAQKLPLQSWVETVALAR